MNCQKTLGRLRRKSVNVFINEYSGLRCVLMQELGGMLGSNEDSKLVITSLAWRSMASWASVSSIFFAALVQLPDDSFELGLPVDNPDGSRRSLSHLFFALVNGIASLRKDRRLANYTLISYEASHHGTENSPDRMGSGSSGRSRLARCMCLHARLSYSPKLAQVQRSILWSVTVMV